MTVCVISQPRFFPGLHYLHRMMVADIFVILDTVQYTPRHEENRAKLKTPNGPQWLTAPIQRHSRTQPISEISLNVDDGWRTKAHRTLDTLYSKAPFYAEQSGAIVDILQTPYAKLTDLDCASWQPALGPLGIACRFVRASELPVAGKGSVYLLDICRHLNADVYLSGAFGRDYLELDRFADHDIAVRFHHYDYPEYPQRFGEFVPYLSYLDMLFNASLDRATVMAGGAMLA